MEPETNSGSESIVDKTKAQIDTLKTKEGRDALKDKAKDGVEGAKKLWFTASIAQKAVVLAVVVLVTIYLTRSCSSNAPVVLVTHDGVKEELGGARQENKTGEPKFDGSVDLAKVDDKTDSQKSFVGFTFGTSADKFKDVKEVNVRGEGRKYYSATSKLKSRFRLFDSAVLHFTQKDKRLYKIIIKTTAEKMADYKPTSILRETQYCANIIEKKYGARFSSRSSSLYSGENPLSSTARTIGSDRYISYDSIYAIAPVAKYHGFFNNTIEIECRCGDVSKYSENNYLGIIIEAMDHSVIEEDGGRTKTIKLDADDDQDNL